MVAFNRISAKHVDFLICAAAGLSPILAIELDDKSHKRPDRQSRDAFIDQALAAAEIPVVHVKAQRSYNLEEVQALIAEAIGDDA